MITLTIDVGSFFAGLIIGFVLGGFVFFITMFGDSWSLGFSDGWKCGKEYGEKKQAEREC